MQLLDAVEIHGRGGARIELWQGDLTKLSPDEAVDVLVVSAFPNDYRPTPTSLIGALDAKGLSVGVLARDKDIDLRARYGCWLSRPVDATQPGLRFTSVLCFEPLERGKPPEVVGDIFRALTPILAVRPEITSVAMPIVSAGDMGYPVTEILEPLLDAAIHWLEIGLPLNRLAIVAHSDADAEEARRAFADRKAAYAGAVEKGPERFDFDAFISYSRENAAVADALVAALKAASPGIRVFVDRYAIDVGAAWQIEIFTSLARSRKVVALLSPQYVSSKACQEEFNTAWIGARRTDRHVLFPVYVYSADLPDYMLLWNYLDCREGDQAKMADVAQALLAALDQDPVTPGAASAP
jgi:hypothetical protein